MCSAVEEAVFSATASACGAVVAYFLDSFVVISVLEHGAVVAGEDNHGVVEDTLFLKMVDKLSDTPVGLNYSVAAGGPWWWSRQSVRGERAARGAHADRSRGRRARRHVR